MSLLEFIISEELWEDYYIGRLRKIHAATARKMDEYLSSHEIVTLQDWNALIQFAYGLTTGYGEAAAALACEMYDLIARKSGKDLPPAVPAPTPPMHEVAKAVRGTGKSGNPELVVDAVERLVKRTGVDTTMLNALRDGAEWAWIPHGDTCAFCLMLASNGWQRASKAAMKDGHAKHIHANCDCTYAVSFNGKTSVAGYDPSQYQRIYDSAAGSSWEEKLNNIRNEQNSARREEINAQARAAYANRKAREAEGGGLA